MYLIDGDAVLNNIKYMCHACGKRDKDNGIMCRTCLLDDAISIIENSEAVVPEPDTASMQSEIATEIQKILDYLDNELHPLVSPNNWNVYSELYDMVSELKTLSPSSQRKKGKWVNANDEKWNTVEVLKCSVCGEIDNRMYRTDKFCPNCGAEMGNEYN